MSKILAATCNADGLVTSEGVEVDVAELLSEGKQISEGFILMQGGAVYYLTSNATDIKTTLDKVADALGEISSALTAIGAGMLGAATAPPPTLGASVSAINALASDLDTLKGALK